MIDQSIMNFNLRRIKKASLSIMVLTNQGLKLNLLLGCILERDFKIVNINVFAALTKLKL